LRKLTDGQVSGADVTPLRADSQIQRRLSL